MRAETVNKCYADCIKAKDATVGRSAPKSTSSPTATSTAKSKKDKDSKSEGRKSAGGVNTGVLATSAMLLISLAAGFLLM